jgi:uncharacterized membrane protein
MIDALVAWTHVVGWSFHFGGALLMELVWRPAQEGMPQSQIGVACQWMGRRYRWISAASLAVLGASGAVMAARSDHSLSLHDGYGRNLAVLVLLWLALVAVLAVLSISAHPGLHARMAPDATDEERGAARAQVARAIVRMDRLLRLELVLSALALLAGASLHVVGER